MHVLNRKILHINISVHLMDVQTGARACVRFRFLRRKQKKFGSYHNNKNCDDNDHMMSTHEGLHYSWSRLGGGGGQKLCRLTLNLHRGSVDPFNLVSHINSEVGQSGIGCLPVE